MVQAINARMARVELGAVTVLTLLALVLRFYKLGEWSFWIDEIYTINRANAHYGSMGEIINSFQSTIWLPLSVILTGSVLEALGTSEWSARLVPAIIGVITIPALYIPTRKLFGSGVALIAAFLLTISPWHLYWSQNARFYTALLLLYSLALFAFFFCLEQDRPVYILLSLPLLYLALSERMVALFIVPVAASYLLSLKILPFAKPPGLRTRNLLLIVAPAIAFLILEVYTFVSSGSSFLVYIYNTFSGRPIDSPMRILILIAFNIGLPLMGLAVFSGIYLLSQRSRAGLFLFLGAVFPPILLAAVNPFVFTVDRYVFMILPSWIILGAIAVTEITVHMRDRGKVLAAGVLALLLADAAGAHLMYYQLNHGNRLQWREAFAWVQVRSSEKDIIVSTRPELGSYYMGEEIVNLGDIKPDQIQAKNQRVWFVIDSEGVWHAPLWKKRWLEEHTELLDVWYLRVREQISLRFYLYDPERQ